MKKQLWIVVTAILIAKLVFASNPTQSDRVVMQTIARNNVAIHCDLSGIDYQKLTLDGLEYLSPCIEGEGITQETDRPKLPAVSRWIALPQGKRLEFTVKSDKITVISEYRPPVAVGVNQSVKAVNGGDYKLQGLYPPSPVKISEPFSMRHIRLVQLTVYPVQYEPASGSYYERSSMDLDIRFVDDPNYRSDSFERIPSPQFQRLIEGLVLNPPPHRDDNELITVRGYNEYYLYVLPESVDEEFQSQVEALVYRMMEWKRKSGNKVDLLRIPEEDAVDTTAVVDYIPEYYQQLLENGIEPFDNILLIGEEELHPHNNNQGGQGLDIMLLTPYGPFEQNPWQGHWDMYYSYLEGDDYIPDAALSRFHTGNLAMLANGVNKTLYYESQPCLDNPAWFSRAALVEEAILGGGASVRFSVDYMKQVLEHNGIEVTAERRLGEETIPGGWIGNRFSEGIGFFGGRAVNTDIAYHSGGTPQNYFEAVGMFPVAILASGHGEYAMESMFWFGREYYDDPERFNDLNGAKGAVVSTGTWQDPQTIPNNALCMGMTHSMLDLGLNFGWARNWTLLNLYRTFPDNEDVLVQYSDDFQLCGDVGLQCWKGIPDIIAMDYPHQISPGTNHVKVKVYNPMGDAPVPGMLVTLYKGDIDEIDLFRIGITDGWGICDFYLEPDLEGTIQVTACSEGVYPVMGMIEITGADANIVIDMVEIVDHFNGNDDGIANPGESLALALQASNLGEAQTVHNVSAQFACTNPYVNITRNDSEFGDIEAGESLPGNANLLMELAADCPDGEDIIITADITGDEGTWTSAILLDPVAFALNVVNIENNGVIEPGEHNLRIDLRNDGRAGIGAFTASLVSSGWEIDVVESEVNYPAIQVDQTGQPQGNGFVVNVHPMSIPGRIVPIKLEIRSGIQLVGTVDFSLQVSETRADAPWGPDSYGYYCFDDTDRDWDMAPRYFWTEISARGQDPELESDTLAYTNSNNGWGVVDLPFTFNYYGREYDQITVCTNGYLMMGVDPYFVPNPDNWHLDGGGIGSGCGLIAPFWDNFQILPAEDRSDISMAFDDWEHAFIIEWSNARFIGAQTTVCFQVFLYDPAYRPTPTGDGDILFQYKEISVIQGNPFNQTQYMTVGITSPDGQDGITYTAHGEYPVSSAEIEDERAILFTTTPREMYGRLHGSVVDGRTFQPIEGAVITTTTYNSAVTDIAGEWEIGEAWAGFPYSLTISNEGYNSTVMDDLYLEENGEHRFEVSLNRPGFRPDDRWMHQVMRPDTVIERELTILNTGYGVLEWTAAKRLRDVDNPLPWTPIAHIALAVLEDYLPVGGVAFVDDRFYVAARGEDDANGIYIINSEGEQIDNFAIPGDSTSIMQDLTSENGLLWGAVGDVVYLFEHNGNPQEIFQFQSGTVQAMTWNDELNMLWISGYAGGIFGCNRQGELVTQLSSGNLAMQGLAYWGGDPDGYPLYVLHSPDHGRRLISKINPETGMVRSVVELETEPGSEPGGAFIARDFDHNSLVFITTTQTEDQAAIDVLQLSDQIDWFTVQPVSGEIQPGEEQVISVNFDSRNFPLGQYTAELVIQHNSAGGEYAVRIDLEIALDAPGEETVEIPTEFMLSAPYPNPFNSLVQIRYALPDAANVQLAVFDLTGRLVDKLVCERQNAGEYQLVWGKDNLASGLYLLHLKADGRVKTRKITLVK